MDHHQLRGNVGNCCARHHDFAYVIHTSIQSYNRNTAFAAEGVGRGCVHEGLRALIRSRLKTPDQDGIGIGTGVYKSDDTATEAEP